jgi:hypothetical protein
LVVFEEAKLDARSVNQILSWPESRAATHYRFNSPLEFSTCLFARHVAQVDKGMWFNGTKGQTPCPLSAVEGQLGHGDDRTVEA